MKAMPRPDVGGAWRIHAVVCAISLCICFVFIQLSRGSLGDTIANVLRNAPQSQAVRGSGSVADPEAVFGNPKASWTELAKAVGALTDAEVIALLRDSNAQTTFANSNRESLNY